MSDSVLAVEVFAGKDSAGNATGVALLVPLRCGLREADSLRIDGNKVFALRDRSVLPVSLPDLSSECRVSWLALAELGQPLAVGELTALGVSDSYFLKLDFVH